MSCYAPLRKQGRTPIDSMCATAWRPAAVVQRQVAVQHAPHDAKRPAQGACCAHGGGCSGSLQLHQGYPKAPPPLNAAVGKQEPSAPESDDPDEDMRILTRDALSALAPDTDVRVRPVPQCARLQFVMYDIVVHNLQPCHGEPLTSRLEKLRSLWTHRFQKPDYLNVATTHIRYPAHHDAAKVYPSVASFIVAPRRAAPRIGAGEK